MINKFDTISEESIKILVDNFYQKIRVNKELAPIFENQIGTSQAQWQPHLQNMYNFWSSVMISSGKYKGNPMKKHRDLPLFDENKFDIWLDLFSKTVHEIHTDEIATHYLEKSQNIARSLRYGLYHCGPR